MLAHQHPSGITDLVTPAVVRVEAESRVEITLLDHVGELLHVERSYDVPIGVGTGFVVNPEGTIVVPTEVVKTDKKVEIYAANRIFAEHHKVPIPDDYEKHRVENNDVLDHHLQACYDTESKTSTCIIDVTTEITVFPNIQPADSKGFKAEIVHTGDRPEAPAVIRPVQQNGGGTGLPTARWRPRCPTRSRRSPWPGSSAAPPPTSSTPSTSATSPRAAPARAGARSRTPRARWTSPPSWARWWTRACWARRSSATRTARSSATSWAAARKPG
ncbi:hypothetical protein [Thermocatellispora tengchongensis]|uniref:hypothetical protein n=1 Tax=Thermocatellispora tengchongensis TaxID=1073253 RepID=UPI00363EE0D6